MLERDCNECERYVKESEKIATGQKFVGKRGNECDYELVEFSSSALIQIHSASLV